MILLTSVDPDKNRARWYTLAVQPRLFGGVDVIRRWGRLGNNGGSEMSEAFDTEEQAATRVDAIIRQRLARGYQVVSMNAPPQKSPIAPPCASAAANRPAWTQAELPPGLAGQ